MRSRKAHRSGEQDEAVVAQRVDKPDEQQQQRRATQAPAQKWPERSRQLTQRAQYFHPLAGTCTPLGPPLHLQRLAVRLSLYRATRSAEQHARHVQRPDSWLNSWT